MLLYCVRHGQTLHNEVGRIQGQSESELSPLGWRQCRALADELRKLPIDAVYSSPLRRALDGAKLIADALGQSVRIDERLMELSAGVFQGLTWEQAALQYPADAARWRSHEPEFRIPGGESRRELMLRGRQAFEAICAAGHNHAVIVAHGGLLAAALKALLDIPAQRNPFQFLNGSISRLAWDGQLKVLSLNQVEHLHGEFGSGGDL